MSIIIMDKYAGVFILGTFIFGLLVCQIDAKTSLKFYQKFGIELRDDIATQQNELSKISKKRTLFMAYTSLFVMICPIKDNILKVLPMIIF